VPVFLPAVAFLDVVQGSGDTMSGTRTLVECRVDVAAAKMGHDNLSARSHDTENLRKLDFVSLESVART